MDMIASRRKPLAGWAAAASTAVLLSACAMTPHPFTTEEFAAKGQADRAAMFAQSEPLTRPLTLADAVARVLHDNLDARAKMMEEAVAMGQLDLDRFTLLPNLVAGGGYLGRSDHATVTSRNAVTLQPALSDPYYSLDRDRKVGDLTMSWNVLDFGVSWYTAHQNADRALIMTERRRKAVAALTQEVRFAFWRAAAAQKLDATVAHSIDTADGALRDAKEVEAEQLRNPVDALRYRKTLLDNLSQLEIIQQQLGTAKAELAALINLPPGQDFTLAVPPDSEMTVPPWTLPVEKMEVAAFINNPDLREQVYQTRVAADETHKAFLRLLPGLNLSAGRHADSNTFLMDNYWNEASAQLSFNLVNIVSAPAPTRSWRMRAGWRCAWRSWPRCMSRAPSTTTPRCSSCAPIRPTMSSANSPPSSPAGRRATRRACSIASVPKRLRSPPICAATSCSPRRSRRWGACRPPWASTSCHRTSTARASKRSAPPSSSG